MFCSHTCGKERSGYVRRHRYSLSLLENYAKPMADVLPPPAPDAMEGVVAAAPEAPAAPAEPENISETLYIQNLNEKIKIDGKRALALPLTLPLWS